MVSVYLVLVLAISGRLARKLFGRRQQTWFEAASRGRGRRLRDARADLREARAAHRLVARHLPDAARHRLPALPRRRRRRSRASRRVAMITEDLGRPPSQVFRSFDETPLSAASIGQVHACVLPDGREAVIKLQRPDIRDRMTTDLRIMHRLARTLEKHVAFAKNSNAVAIIEDLHAVTFSELNPAVEAYRQDRFRDGHLGLRRQPPRHRPRGLLGLLRPAHDLHGAHVGRADGPVRRDPRHGRRRRARAAARRQGVARGGGRARPVPRRHARRQHLGARGRPGAPSSTSGSWASCPTSGSRS